MKDGRVIDNILTDLADTFGTTSEKINIETILCNSKTKEHMTTIQYKSSLEFKIILRWDENPESDKVILIINWDYALECSCSEVVDIINRRMIQIF